MRAAVEARKMEFFFSPLEVNPHPRHVPRIKFLQMVEAVKAEGLVRSMHEVAAYDEHGAA